MFATGLLILAGALLLLGCWGFKVARRTRHELIAFLLFVAGVGTVCAAVFVAEGWSPKAGWFLPVGSEPADTRLPRGRGLRRRRRPAPVPGTRGPWLRR